MKGSFWVVIGFILICTDIADAAVPKVRQQWIRKRAGHVAAGLVDDNREHIVIASVSGGTTLLTGYTRHGHVAASASYTGGSAEAIAANKDGAVAVAGATCCYPGRVWSVVYAPFLRGPVSEGSTIPAEPNGWAYEADVHGLALDQERRAFVTGAARVTLSGEDDDFFIASFQSGSPIWLGEYWPGADSSEGSGVAVRLTTSGDVIVVGNQRRNYGSHFLVLRYSPTGELMWQVRFPFDNTAALASAVQVDLDDNIIIVGRSAATDYGLYSVPRILTVKLSANGEALWSASETVSGSSDGAQAVTTDNDSNVYVTAPGWTGKYAAGGLLVWSGSKGGTALCLDKSNNVFFSSSVPSDREDSDVETVKLDPLGRQIWNIVYNGRGNTSDQFQGMIVRDGDGIYVTATSSTAAANQLVTIKYIERNVPRRNAKR